MSQFQATRPCIICHDQKQVSHYCSFDKLEYVRCNHCGLLYVDNFADNQEMHKAYTGGSLKSFRRKLFAPFRKMRSIKGYSHFLHRARGIFAFAKQYIEAGQQKKFLDIGCNKGFLLSAGIEEQYDVYGVELVTVLVRPFCNTYPQFSTQVYSDKFCDVAQRFAAGYFDLITAIDVVEHFEDPMADMKEVHRILKDGGAFVIQTPDIDCQQAKTLECNWGALKPLEHLHLFGGENFVNFAKQAGFREITIHNAFEEADGNFVAVLKK